MKKTTKGTLSLGLLILLLIATVSVASAAILVSGSFKIKNHTLSGAQAPGGRLSSSSYELTGAWGGPIGVSSGSSYSLCVGHACGAAPSGSLNFLPLVTK